MSTTYAASVSPSVTETISGGTVSAVDYIVIIAMENQNYGSVIGSPFAPFINSLLGSPYFGATIPSYHGAYPGSSAGSYTAVVSGNTYGVSNGVSYGSINALTIVDGFEAVRRTWRVLQESSSPIGNSAWLSGSFRGPDHNGFTQFSTVTDNPARAANLILGDAQQVNPNSLLSLIRSPSPPNFLWYTPNDTNNTHDPSNNVPVAVADGDSYLSSFVPQILSAPVFQQGRALLMLWWDELDPAPNVFVGARVKPGFVSQATNLGHYSTLRFIENLWGMAPMSNGPDYPSGDIGAVPLDIL